MTPLKKQVVNLFMGGACGLSARDVLDELGNRFHISTVHRCLASLEAAGFLRHSRNTEGIQRFRCTRGFYPDHGHFVCRDCGRVLPVLQSLPVEFISGIEDRLDSMITGSDFVLEGRCSECRAQL